LIQVNLHGMKYLYINVVILSFFLAGLTNFIVEKILNNVFLTCQTSALCLRGTGRPLQMFRREPKSHSCNNASSSSRLLEY